MNNIEKNKLEVLEHMDKISKKVQEMEKRMKVIKESGASLSVSYVNGSFSIGADRDMVNLFLEKARLDLIIKLSSLRTDLALIEKRIH